MAKSKKAVVDSEIFCTAQEAIEEEQNSSLVSIGPALDAKLGGGIPEGSLVLIRGLAATGKSLTAMQLVANALKQGRHVIYADVERRLTASKYFKVKGLDIHNPKFMMIRSKVDEPTLSGDKIYKNIMNMMMMPKYKGAVYVVDSFSKVIPHATLIDEEIKGDRRDTTPKLNADFCKKAGNLARTTKSIIFGIQHFITNTSGYGDPLVPDGGVKLEFEADICIECRHKPYDWNGERINLDKISHLEGQLMKCSLTKNKLLAPHIAKKDNLICCYYKFGEGTWWAREALDLLSDEMGLVYINKSWYNIILPDGTELKAQGADKAVLLIEENRELFEEIIKNYFINKYSINYDFKSSEDTE
jgi:archaellum biogenesis ATPase FlaH